MSGEVARVVEGAAKDVEQGLAKDFSGAYKQILHDTADGAEQIADRTDRDEATLSDLAHGVDHSGAASGAEHAITTGAEGTVGHEAAGAGGHGPVDDPTLRGGAADPAATATELGDRTTCDDPIDVTSGEMVLAQTDLELAGALPLVLRRVHVSSYRAGRLFGPSWAATLDQRLELDDSGVCFADEDGVILVYQVPRQGEPEMPVEGARRPLTWWPDGSMTVTDPPTGVTRTFAPLPGVPLRNGHAAVLPIRTIADRNGDMIEFDYAEDGTLIQLRHSGGYRVTVESDGGLVRCLRLHGDTSGYETALTDGADGADGLPLVRFRYDGDGDLVEILNSSGRPLVLTYDRHRVTGWTDRNGTAYRYTYDGAGRVIRTSGSGGVLSGALEYDPVRRVTVATNSLGHASIYRYDERRRITKVTGPVGAHAESTWDRYGRPLSHTDALGRTVGYGYDENGNRTWIEQPDGARSTTNFNGLNLPVEVTAPDGGVWRYTYDDRGNLLTRSDPAGARITCAYDDRGHLAAVTDPLGRTLTFTCDPAGLPVRITDITGASRTLTRDAFGRVTATTDPIGGTTRLRWTVEGRIAHRTDETGAVEGWAYDPEGNLAEYRDAAGGTTTIETTHFDLPSARTGPDGARYEFAYDTELRLVTVTNPLGLAWRYEYDPSGNLVSETDFNGRASTYAYDPAGRLTASTNAGGRTVAFAYDAVGRVVEQRAGDAVTTYAYDAAGWLARAADADTELTFERDRLGRVLAETVNGRTLRNVYDAAGQRVRRVTPAGVESVWAYDAHGRPAALHATTGTLDFEYDAAGRETARRFGATISVERTWDAAHRPATVTTVGHADRAHGDEWRTHRFLAQQQAYTYRPDGYPTAVDDDLRGPRRYTLDPVGRVTRVTAGVWTGDADSSSGSAAGGGVPRVPGDPAAAWTEEYAYDAAGDLIDRQVTGPEADPDVDGPRSLHGLLVREAGRVHYEHDADGRPTRTIRRTLSGQRLVWTYTWDELDRLTHVVTPDGTTWRYRYDPLGRRIAKQRLADDGRTVAEQTDFTWDETHLAEQTRRPTGDGPDETLTWDYEPDTHTPAAQTVTRHGDTPDQADVDRRFYAIVTDLIGTPTELLGAEGSFAWRANNDLWGGRLRPYAGDVDCPLRFPGQYHDHETGWHYNLHRYYNPATAAYVTPDPLGLAAAPNHLAYAPNPLAWLDPWGLATCLQITDHLWDHVFKGEINKSGRAVGYHFRPGGEDYAHGFAVKSMDFGATDANGVYKGTVFVRDWNGNTWVRKGPQSTFFPENWSQEKVKNAITRAIQEGKITNAAGGVWQGTFKGISIRGYFDPVTKVVTTAYPVHLDDL